MIPRSWLFVPADDPAKLDKAWASGAEAVILDLEDSVAPARKAEARVNARDFLKRRGQGGPQAWVRVNALSSGLIDDDLHWVVQGAPDGIVLPKPDSAKAIERMNDKLDRLEVAHQVRMGSVHILPIATETPRSLFALDTYADLPEGGRVIGLTWGAEDLPAAVGADSGRHEDGSFTDLCRVARALCLAAGAAAGLPVLETVFPAHKDLEGLKAFAEQSRREGFQGMLAIHPDQVEIINAAYTPSEKSLERARRIVALFQANPGVGVMSMDGEMVDAPHLAQARRILAQA